MKKRHVLYLFLSFAVAIMIGCQDEVDQSNMFTFVGQTMTQYIQEDSNFTMFAKVLEKSKVSNKTQSHLDMLLSARGNYTCFLPTNEAVSHYLDSIYSHQPYDFDTISEVTANTIAQNCIIDHGNFDALKAAELVEGTINDGTLNDRHIQVTFGNDSEGNFQIILNGMSRVIIPDIEVENGMIHVVNRVISPSNSNLSSLINQARNMRIFDHLLQITGWADSMLLFRDEAYEMLTTDQLTKRGYKGPEHKYYGYTAFIEPDSVYYLQWGVPGIQEVNGEVTNWDEIVSVIEKKAKEYYTEATSNNYLSPDNALNNFVAYHLLDYRVPFNQLVHHFTEYGYNYAIPEQLVINVWDYYVTRYNEKILKVTQPAATGTLNINRHCTYDNGFFGTYKEKTCDREGIIIHATNGTYSNNALNGFYYPIDSVLVYDQGVPNNVLNERLRFHIIGTLGEFYTNYLRCPNLSEHRSYVPPAYAANITQTDETDVVYATNNTGWMSVQGDRLEIYGQYDLTLKLPRVPVSGTYELRFGTSNLANRGMCQVYLGTNRLNLPAIGLPYDQRNDGTSVTIGYVADTNDLDANEENDKTMRHHEWMKGPKYFCQVTRSGPHILPLRNVSHALRRIVYRGYLDQNKTYYVRLKSVLENPEAYIFYNYFELVPKNVYDNPDVSEDIW